MEYELFKSRLSVLMQELDISSKQLALMSGISEAALSRYLNGLRTPTVENVISLANTLNVTTDYLLGLSDVADDKKLIQAYSVASDDDKRVVWAVLDKYGG